MNAVMLGLNSVLNYEVHIMLEVWYGDEQDQPDLQTVDALPQEVRQALGIYYRPSV